MNSYLKEMLITEYYRYKSLIGEFMDDDKALFFKLGSIFLLPSQELQPLYEAVNNERVNAIKTESDFNRFQREMQYFALSGIKYDVSELEKALILMKGNAIVQLKESNCAFETQQTKMVVENSLLNQANQGVILAMRLTAFLMTENFFLNKSQAQGEKLLAKCVCWNDVTSMLYALYYGKGNIDGTLSRLTYLLEKDAHLDVCLAIEKAYGKSAIPHAKETELLEALFKLGTFKRDVYSASYARALYSKALDYKNKEKLFFSASKDFLSMAGDLPLKLEYNGNAKYDYSALTNLPLNREEETLKIKRALDNSDLRQQSFYKPLCLVTDSAYLTALYTEAIKNLTGSVNLETINASELDMQDFEPTKNNIFVRLCNEDKDNVYLFCLQGEVDNRVLGEIKAFLKTQNRRKFRISTPNVTLDLSPVLPVCICDEQNLSAVKSFCEVIKLAQVSDLEKPLILEDVLRLKARDYQVASVEVQEDAKKKLLELSVDDIEQEVDTAVRNNRQKGSKILLTKESFSFENKNFGDNRYGFGGIINENE